MLDIVGYKSDNIRYPTPILNPGDTTGFKGFMIIIICTNTKRKVLAIYVSKSTKSCHHKNDSALVLVVLFYHQFITKKTCKGTAFCLRLKKQYQKIYLFSLIAFLLLPFKGLCRIPNSYLTDSFLVSVDERYMSKTGSGDVH